LKKYSYIIIDDDPLSNQNTRTVVDGFLEFAHMASATNYHEGLNLVLEYHPDVVFLEIDPQNNDSDLSLLFINALHRYLTYIPKIIITTANRELAFDAIQYQVFDYILKPLDRLNILKVVFKLNKIESDFDLINVDSNNVSVRLTDNAFEKPLVICIKSYGDYRYLRAVDICYFQADNNSTDIYLNSGEMITAFKTLKHFETILSHPFIRIHNSYIINKNYISRIHNGNSACYIRNLHKKIPFSKTYKSNIDLIIAEFASENYLEV
jgi:two-component system LytT family response regulator